MDETLNTVTTENEGLPSTPDVEVTGSYDFDVTAGWSEAAPTEITTEATPAETVPAEVAPTIEPEPTDRSISFTAKIDHNETPVTIKESEVATYYQKAQNMDRAVQRASEAQSQVDSLTSQRNRIAAIAKATLNLEGDDPDSILSAMEENMKDTAVRIKAGGFKKTDAEIAEAHVRSTLEDAINESMNSFGVSKAAEPVADTSGNQETQPAAEQTSASARPPFEQFSADLERLLQVRPDIQSKDFPEEVMSTYIHNGGDLLSAYAAYEAKQTTAENAELKRQNAILQQNQSSASRAPLRSGVSTNGASVSAEDPWVAGFNSKRW